MAYSNVLQDLMQRYTTVKSYEVYVFRRIALRWTQQELAEKANIDVKLVCKFEEGTSLDKDLDDKIKLAINKGFKELESIDHYKCRILELAFEIKYETSDNQRLYRMSHIIVELGKLQKEILDNITANKT